jgi:transcriptional regulator with XRE-family HTH domain
MDVRQRVGQNLRRLRLETGWSQEDFAFECGIHRTYISGLERGVRNPTIMVLDKIAKALKVPPAVLLEDVPRARKTR